MYVSIYNLSVLKQCLITIREAQNQHPYSMMEVLTGLFLYLDVKYKFEI